jgi:hypothetical protein
MTGSIFRILLAVFAGLTASLGIAGCVLYLGTYLPDVAHADQYRDVATTLLWVAAGCWLPSLICLLALRIHCSTPPVTSRAPRGPSILPTQ